MAMNDLLVGLTEIYPDLLKKRKKKAVSCWKELTCSQQNSLVMVQSRDTFWQCLSVSPWSCATSPSSMRPEGLPSYQVEALAALTPASVIHSSSVQRQTLHGRSKHGQSGMHTHKHTPSPRCAHSTHDNMCIISVVHSQTHIQTHGGSDCTCPWHWSKGGMW